MSTQLITRNYSNCLVYRYYHMLHYLYVGDKGKINRHAQSQLLTLVPLAEKTETTQLIGDIFFELHPERPTKKQLTHFYNHPKINLSVYQIGHLLNMSHNTAQKYKNEPLTPYLFAYEPEQQEQVLRIADLIENLQHRLEQANFSLGLYPPRKR